MRILDAVNFGSVQDLIASLQAGENPNLYDKHQFTPLLWASNRLDRIEMDKIKVLLEAGADPNMPDGTGITPMACAIAKGRMDLIEILREHGASLKCVSDRGSLIADAVLGRQLHLIPYLVRERVEINLISQDGFTPLMLAAGNSVAEAIPILLAEGAEVDLRDSNHGLTAYLHAALVGDNIAGRMLIDAGAVRNATSNEGKTASMLAMENGHDWDQFERK